ncbi:MAG: chemotaxis protein CheB [Gammaproteobacteria bacterium]
MYFHIGTGGGRALCGSLTTGEMDLRASSEASVIVGIGASAGGLDSMLALFAKLKVNGRAAYIVAQHMAHDAHSELIARLLNRESALPVVPAMRDQLIQADQIYLIPAGWNGVVDERRLLLRAPAENSLSTPSANVLFESIARSQGSQSIGIVLSGTGRDGAIGCQAIKAVGGTTMVQAPETTKFNGMPRSAIEAKAVDFALSVELIAAQLKERFQNSGERSSVATNIESSNPPDHRELPTLLSRVLQATGIDFSGYKEETLLRRLDKRLSMLGIATLGHYLDYIAGKPEELKTLQHLFLVSLSSFFRDPESFARLEMPLTELVGDKTQGEMIRVWVPGCATGEEVFTLAIMLAEIMGKHFSEKRIQILGTDINTEAIQYAKRGLYRQTAFRTTDPWLLQRYFQEKGHHFEVAERLRGVCRFELGNVSDPGSTNGFDLISCRNLMIYMKSQLQSRLIENFYFMLRLNGLLFVGQAESIGVMGNALFYPVDHYHKIYRRRP